MGMQGAQDAVTGRGPGRAAGHHACDRARVGLSSYRNGAGYVRRKAPQLL